MTEALDSFGNLHKRAELRQAQDFAVHHVADAMRIEERLPGIGLKLFDAKREPPLLRLNSQDDRADLLALLQDLGRMLDPLGPAQIADVDKAVNSIFDLDKRAKVGQVANTAFHDRIDGIALMQAVPG